MEETITQKGENAQMNPIAQLGQKRFVSLDLARGFMLLLVALAHASLFLGSSLLTRPESMSMYDTIVNYLSVFLVDNRARAMFALLFGYGLTLIVRSYLKRNKPIKDAKTSLYRRAWFLILFGFILSVLIGGKDILAIYGTALFACCWLLFRSDKTVLRSIMAVSLAYAVILPLTWIAMAYAQFNGNAILPGNYAHYFERVTSQFIQFATGGPFIAHFLLPVGVSILIGIYFGQKGLLNESPKNKPFLKKAAVYGLSISLIGALPHALYSNQLIELPPALVGLTFSLHMATGILGGVAYAAIFGLIGPKITNPSGIVWAITSLGKRSLTFFIYNEIMLIVLFSKQTLNLGNQLGMAAGWGLTLCIWLTALGCAAWLESKQKSGPIDHLFRKLVYRKSSPRVS
jgi:uncharacterized protein